MHDELTAVDIQKMQEEINYRVRELRPQLIEEVQTARAFGDLSENYEYKCAKQAKNRNDSRIRYLERMIRTAKVIEVKETADAVGLFDTVTVYNEMMKRNYWYEIGKIEGQAIDVAFVPLDPRQEEQYYWGMDYFMKHTDTKVVFPMHMWGHYEVWERLMENPEASSYRDKVMRITKAPQEFEIG